MRHGPDATPHFQIVIPLAETTTHPARQGCQNGLVCLATMARMMRRAFLAMVKVRDEAGSGSWDLRLIYTIKKWLGNAQAGSRHWWGSDSKFEFCWLSETQTGAGTHRQLMRRWKLQPPFSSLQNLDARRRHHQNSPTQPKSIPGCGRIWTATIAAPTRLTKTAKVPILSPLWGMLRGMLRAVRRLK